jgi:hypothetical protein
LRFNACTPRAFGIIIFVSIPPYVAQMLPDWHMIESAFIAGLAACASSSHSMFFSVGLEFDAI